MTYDNRPAWQIFEEKIFKSRPLANLTRSTVDYGFVDYGAADNTDALKKGWILKADSIEELAKKIAETSVIDVLLAMNSEDSIPPLQRP